MRLTLDLDQIIMLGQESTVLRDESDLGNVCLIPGRESVQELVQFGCH